MAAASSITPSKDVETDFSPYLKVYKDGTVERIFGSPEVPPSPDVPDPITNVLSKDINISPDISARIYLPANPTQKLPVLVYYHGGGFCLESAFSFLDHRYINLLVSKSNAIAVSVEYRLAPEHPLPAAFEDSWVALQWVASHNNAIQDTKTDCNKEAWLMNHGDFDKLYVAGDSAGGNIAYNMAMRAGAEKSIKVSGAVLSFPYFCDEGTDQESMPYKMWMLAYPSARGGIKNPLIDPFSDDAPKLFEIGCKRVFLCCAEKDELRDIDLRFGEALKKSGWNGELEVVDVEGEDHCFHIFDTSTEKAESLINSIATFIGGC